MHNLDKQHSLNILLQKERGKVLVQQRGCMEVNVDVQMLCEEDDRREEGRA